MEKPAIEKERKSESERGREGEGEKEREKEFVRWPGWGGLKGKEARREVRRIHPPWPLGKRGGWVAGPTGWG